MAGGDGRPVGDEAVTPPDESMTQAVRSLIDAVIRTEVGAKQIAAARAHVEAALGLLIAQLMPGSYGLRPTTDGDRRPAGNVLIGARNAIAPPLTVDRDGSGLVSTDVNLGAAYEGPAGHVHGGICSLILDHLLGATAHRPDRPAFTGTLELRYLHPTPLGRLRAEAWVEREDGRKTHAYGRILVAGRATVEARGVFIRARTDTDR